MDINKREFLYVSFCSSNSLQSLIFIEITYGNIKLKFYINAVKIVLSFSSVYKTMNHKLISDRKVTAIML